MEANERLKQAREKAGYETAALAAKAIGVSYGTYASHENGNRGVKRDDVTRYAKFFGVDQGWLAFGQVTSVQEEVATGGQESKLVADWIIRKLVECDASQGDLARALGLDRSIVSKFLKGARLVSLADLFGIADFFGVRPAAILEEIATPQTSAARHGDEAGMKPKARSLASVRDGEALVADLQDGRRISRPEATILRRAIGVEA